METGKKTSYREGFSARWVASSEVEVLEGIPESWEPLRSGLAEVPIVLQFEGEEYLLGHTAGEVCPLFENEYGDPPHTKSLYNYNWRHCSCLRKTAGEMLAWVEGDKPFVYIVSDVGKGNSLALSFATQVYIISNGDLERIERKKLSPSIDGMIALGNQVLHGAKQ